MAGFAAFFCAQNELLAIAGFAKSSLLEPEICDGCARERVTTNVQGWQFCGECLLSIGEAA